MASFAHRRAATVDATASVLALTSAPAYGQPLVDHDALTLIGGERGGVEGDRHVGALDWAASDEHAASISSADTMPAAAPPSLHAARPWRLIA